MFVSRHYCPFDIPHCVPRASLAVQIDDCSPDSEARIADLSSSTYHRISLPLFPHYHSLNNHNAPTTIDVTIAIRLAQLDGRSSKWQATGSRRSSRYRYERPAPCKWAQCAPKHVKSDANDASCKWRITRRADWARGSGRIQARWTGHVSSTAT